MEQKQQPVKGKKNELIWNILFLLIAAVSVWAVTEQSKSFSVEGFFHYIRNASPVFLSAAVLSMIGFIFFEGVAVGYALKIFGYKESFCHKLTYSASDIYFSAITPSATGGQPASALFMMRDGIPGITATISLLLNLLMYTVSIVIIGLFCVVLRPSLFCQFGTVAKLLICIGSLLQLVLVAIFLLALKNEIMLNRVGNFIIRLFCRLHLMHRREKYEKKLLTMENDYRLLSNSIAGKQKQLGFVLLFNLLQRMCLSLCTMFAFLACGGAPTQAFDIWVTQNYVVLGSNCIPVPGAMGVADYLLLNAFGAQGVNDPVNLELFSRSLSFYCCVILCGIFVLIRFLILKRKQNSLG